MASGEQEQILIEKRKELVVVSEDAQVLKSSLMFSMENCFYVLISQAVLCLKDPSVLPRLKQELSSELSTLLWSLLSGQRAASLTANQTTYTRIQGHAGGPGALRPALDAQIPL